MREPTRWWPSIVLLVLAASPLAAHEHAPRVLSPHNADGYSMKTFAEYPRWRDLRGDELVFEVFRYLVDRRTGLYPMGAGAWEGEDVLYEFGYVRDPVKMLNVYSLGYCDMLGPTAAGILAGMGVGPTRTIHLPDWHHVAAEVFYEGGWHYIDLDLRAVFRRGDGGLASLEEARRDDGLWRGPNGPLFFPLDDLEKTREVYRTTPVEVRHGVHMGGHTMDYVLRRGETLTRWWKPQGGRWNHHESYHRTPALRAILERPPRGPKSKHAGWTVHTHGNGRFVYRPDLTARSADFADGVYAARNAWPGARGLVVEEPGDGHVLFEVRSPYVIVPRVNDLETTDDDRDASVVRIDAEHAALSLSLDNGLTWRGLGPASGTRDLTAHVAGRYGYLLRIELEGAEAVVRSLEIITWCQLHPASLPSLRRGPNTLRYVTGDHYGLASHVVEIRTNGSRRDDFLRYLDAPPEDFDPARSTSRVRGAFVARVGAPPGMKVAWLSAGGSFRTHQGAQAPQTANSMAWAAGESRDFRDFREFYRARVPAGNAHWHYNADVEVRLDEPARTVFVRYEGDPAVNNVRIYAHCIEERAPAPSPVTITHAWRERGELRTRTVTLEGPASYEVTTGDEPEDEWIEIAVPSSGGGRR